MSDQTPLATPPILAEKHYGTPSVFDAANLMREARRQKRLPAGDVPPICVLDPDGDLVDYLRASGQSRPFPAWACTTRRSMCFRSTASSLVSSGGRWAPRSRCWSPKSCSSRAVDC